MKKLLSIILACTILMSLFCVVPASAASIRLGLPYIFEDFEDGYHPLANVTNNNEFGYNSSKSVTATESSTGNQKDFWIQNNGADYAYNFKAGETLQISFMLKLGQALVANKAGVWLRLDANSATPGRIGAAGVIKEPANTTGWQKVTLSHTFEADKISTKFSVRFATELSTRNVGANSETTLTYYIDDLEVKVIPAELGTDVVPFEDFADSNDQISCNNYESMAQADGTTGNVGKYTITKATREVSKWVYASTSGGDLSKEFAAGDKIKLSMDVKLGQALQADRTAGIHLYFRYVDPETSSNKSLGCTATIPNVSDTTNWQHIEAELDAPFAFTCTKSALYFAMGTSSVQSNKHADGTDASSDNPQVYYIDNVSIKQITAAELTAREAVVPVITNAAVVRNSETAIGLGYTFSSGLTDESVVKLVATEGTTKSYLTTYRASEFAEGAEVALPAGAEGKSLSLEIVPVASNGYFGETVTVAVPAYENAPAIEGIVIEKDGTQIKVSTENTLTAKLIFVTYDANRKMTAHSVVDITDLAAQGTQSYDIPSGSTVVMLWSDMSTGCIPLTDALPLN